MIQGRQIGTGHPCFIIAEAGSNHNRDFKLACEMIDVAAQAGADAVKFQLFQGEKHYSRKTPPFEYLVRRGFKKNIVDLLKEIELPLEWVEKLKRYCATKNILFFCTVTSKEDVDLLEKLDIPLYKLASFEIVDLPLIEHIARTGRPMILSTGLANMEELEDAYLTSLRAGNKNIIFLQCASLYPASPGIMNLKAMHTIREAFGCPVGLSDHTSGIHISVAAVAMGACVIEKHFTLDRNLKGPDHFFAIEPSELKLMVSAIRDVESAMGEGRKCGPSKEEEEMHVKARRSLHARMRIPQGTKIGPEMLTIKRPAYGIKPKFLDLLTGRTAQRDIEQDEWITWDMI